MYRNAYWSRDKKCIKFRTWDNKGNRVTVDVPYKPYLYIESPEGNYLSVFDTKLKKFEFNTPYERNQFVKNYGTDRYFDNFDVEQQFLLDTFSHWNNKPDFAKYKLRILWWDIEVDPLPEDAFPDADQALAEINIITAYDTLDEKYHVFSKYPYNGSGLGDNVVFKNCGSEKNLISEFRAFWMSNDYPDIVSGWNSHNYDTLYLKNRIIKNFSNDYWQTFSPYNIITEIPSEDKMGRPVLKQQIAGIDNLDYIDVYIKFKIVKQESYKLDFIAEQEIGYGKVDYEGMTIGEFMTKQWDRFVEYNVRDVELLVKMEKKLQYFTILRNLCNIGLCNYTKGLLTIPITNGGIAVNARRANKVLHTFIRKPSNEPKPGGYVASHAGIHYTCVSFDATSLYPSIVRTLNISPETKIGRAFFCEENEKLTDSFKDEVKFITNNNKEFSLSKKEFFNLLKKHNLNIAFNGVVFSQNKQGLLPEYMTNIFNTRMKVKEEIKQLNRENENIENEIKKLESLL